MRAADAGLAGEIEPVLQRAVRARRWSSARWGVELEDVAQDEEGVTATLRTADGATEQVRCRYLAGCDGGTSRVRQCLGIGLEGQSRVQQRYMTHFRPTRATSCSALASPGTTSRRRAR